MSQPYFPSVWSRCPCLSSPPKVRKIKGFCFLFYHVVLADLELSM